MFKINSRMFKTFENTFFFNTVATESQKQVRANIH